MLKPKKKDNEKKQTCLFTPASENLVEMLNPGKIYARNCELNCGEVGNELAKDSRIKLSLSMAVE